MPWQPVRRRPVFPPVPARGPRGRYARPVVVPPGPRKPVVRAPGAWLRLALLVVLLAGAVAAVAALEPQRLLTHARPPGTSGTTAVVVFALAYGLATVAFVPRPLLNAAAGALYGVHAGLPAAVSGTVLGAGLAFGLGRALGRDAVRPLLRGRYVLAAERQLSRHGFRSTLALRLFPGVPFAAANYAAAVSRARLLPFLVATAAGSVANTAAYVVAGSRAASPTSPVFLLATGFLAVTGVAGAEVVRRGRRRASPAPAADAATGPAPVLPVAAAPDAAADQARAGTA